MHGPSRTGVEGPELALRRCVGVGMTTVGSPRARAPLVVLAAALSVASGATDVTSFTRLGGVFASVMTGNLVLFGLGVERASATLVEHSAVALGGFIVGVAVAGAMARGAVSRQEIWPPEVSAVLLVELVALAAFATGWELSDGRPRGGAQFALLVTAALAMGLQSEAVRRVGGTVATTYLTGTLTATVASFFSKATGTENRRLNVVVLGSVAAGAAAGAGLISVAPAALPFLPLALVVGVVATVRIVGIGH